VTELLQVLVGCDRCGDGREGAKYARVNGVRLCRECWERAGRPYPTERASEVERFGIETKIRERMTERGGNARYSVRAGKV
jgi:hypothetical protein